MAVQQWAQTERPLEILITMRIRTLMLTLPIDTTCICAWLISAVSMASSRSH